MPCAKQNRPVASSLSRRRLLASAAALATLPRWAVAEQIIDLNWADLLPQGEVFVPNVLRDMIDHTAPPLSSQQPASSGVRTDWNGRTVRLPGYIVPIDFDGAGVTAFILVPFVGACVHVSPPRANQLVFVTTPRPYESSGLFEAVNVTGMFGTTATITQVAQIGYALAADKIAPFRS